MQAQKAMKKTGTENESKYLVEENRSQTRESKLCGQKSVVREREAICTL